MPHLLPILLDVIEETQEREIGLSKSLRLATANIAIILFSLKYF